MNARLRALLRIPYSWSERGRSVPAHLLGLLESVRRRGARAGALLARAAIPLLRVSITLAATVGAILVIRWMWFHYELAPWTRDGRVRADIVKVAPDEPGWVASVAVVDSQVVRKGDPLFRLDTARFEIAAHQAEAAVARARAVLAEARREAHRNETLGDLVASEVRQQSEARVQEAAADLARGLADLAAAQLDLKRAVVVAPVNGVVTNLELRPGDYLTAGREALALVDSDSLHVDGYFEETKLRRIRVGDRVSVHLMGESQLLYGRVESIAPAIVDRERTPTGDLVADINPSFTWVRLAQRVPVRIRLDPGSIDVRLIAGRTATVVDLSFGSLRPREWDGP
ncbi:MAG: efflux RND transporter periplasmic adaptor subunit [Hyphomicrobiales bacterium]|nr:efflux RND transporter periplasmic adaptor subunit [Hyphomicrobiales bacterium]